MHGILRFRKEAVAVVEYPASVRRLWRVQPWSSNPLVRTSDRFEVLVRVLAVVVALLAIPLAGAAGTVAYTSAAERILFEKSVKVAVPGVITDDPVRAVRGDRPGGTEEWAEATVQWNRGERVVTATVEVPDTAKRGDDIAVWIGPDGTRTNPPTSSEVAARTGITRGLLVLFAVWTGATAMVVLIGWVLNGRRNAHWESEWRSMDRPLGRDMS